MASVFATARKLGSTALGLFAAGRAAAAAPVATRIGSTATKDELDEAFDQLRRRIEEGRGAVLQEVERSFNEPLQQYLHGQFVAVSSSNVESVAYRPDAHQVLVLFQNGGLYEYSQCDRSVAVSFWEHCQSSPGGAVWDYFRVRGKGNRWAWKKPFRYLTAGSHGYKPKYENKGRWSAEHAAIPRSGDRPASWKRGEGPYPPWF